MNGTTAQKSVFRFWANALHLPHLSGWLIVAGLVGALFGTDSSAWAQIEEAAQPTVRRDWTPTKAPTAEAQAKARALISDVLEPELVIEVDPRYSKIMRTKKPVGRISITHPDILEVVQFSPTEFELIGNGTGQTTLTFWFGGPGGESEVLRYWVRVTPNEAIQERRKIEYADLERMVNELFPNSFVQLTPVADKLVVRGQARDQREAADILDIITAGGAANRSGGTSYRVAVSPYPGARMASPGSSVINMLEIPGEMQVMVKVRIVELNRSALREIGSRLKLNFGDFTLSSNFASGGAFSAVLNSSDVQVAFDMIASNSYSKILAEPNLVTLSGHAAMFHVGGEFAVPTAVGVEGVAAVATTFRGFGTSLQFTPTVLDKDRIRMQVSPTVSTPSGGSVNGIPSLDSRSVSSTVDLRDGQWLAIAGLIQDHQEGNKSRVPLLGDLPIIENLFSHRTITRAESELLVLVSPQLVSHLEADEVPLILPGMEVTEPDDWAFFVGGWWEGKPGCQHRSTVWPVLQKQMLQARHDAKRETRYQKCTERYIQGAHGFTQ